jgi:hypothetical protein
VLVSSDFVQYLLVPWKPEIGRPAELAAFAAICFDETFGSEPGGRALVIARERAHGARIAAALDATLLGSLRSVVAASPLRLRSVQPYLAAACDRLRGSLAARDFLFVLAEPTRSCVLVATAGRWRSLRSTAAGTHPRELARLVEREAQVAGLAEQGMPAVFVHAPGQKLLQLPPCHGVTPRTLSLPGAPDDPLLAMAMAVA